MLQISLFLHPLEKNPYCPTQDIQPRFIVIRHKQDIFEDSKTLIIHNLLINQIINFVLRWQSAV